ncbi:transmembrane sensor [Rubrivivax gelatinosus]|uniref:FecR domain-containing protein n=1 Tax=Rubrivivax gelatinosus TaxID=28068 RepID=UPI0018CB45BD|nr:FecR domain-containing protein [Rubrivivax gelatinosus]MBG6082952.1 transmembrane sensor [Rubrivivax gelatinosus]
MTSTAEDAEVARQAARWMARLWAEDAAAEDHAACARWRAAHPEHERAWQAMQGFDARLRSVPGEAARRALQAPAATRRRVLRTLGLAVAVLGSGEAVRRSEAWGLWAADERCATGEVRTLVLPDGTRLQLASASAVDLRYDAGQRLIVLRAGEILVTSAHDAERRPLAVRTRHGLVRALGTRFLVRDLGAASRVAVYEGAVELQPAGGAAGQRLDAGQSARLADDGVTPGGPADEADTAWTRGLLLADGRRVDELVAQIARYRRGVLRCDPAVGALRVSGVFPLHDPDRALLNLTLALPLRLRRVGGWWITVEADPERR